MKTQVRSLIGDYELFFSDLLSRMKKIGINVTGMPMSHLLYRAEDIKEYKELRDRLKKLCSRFVETQFNDRAVSILILREALLLEDGFSVSMIELPAPRPIHMYPSGLESIGITLGKNLSTFTNQYKNVLTGIKRKQSSFTIIL